MTQAPINANAVIWSISLKIFNIYSNKIKNNVNLIEFYNQIKDIKVKNKYITKVLNEFEKEKVIRIYCNKINYK